MHLRAKTRTLLVAMAVVALSASVAGCSNGPQPPTTTTPGSASSTLPSPPTTKPNKALVGAEVSGSGSWEETQTTTTPSCTISNHQYYSFDLNDQAATFSPQTGQLVVGGVSMKARLGPTSFGVETPCPHSFTSPSPIPGYSGEGGHMLIDLTYPAHMDIPIPALAAGLLPGIYTGTQWVFTSGQGLRSGQGALSCKGFTLGTTAPQTMPGTPGGPNVSCTPKTSSKYSGTFDFTSCPALRDYAPDIHNSCTGSGSATLKVDFKTLTLAPNIVVSPSVLRFAGTQVGKTSAAQTVTISNPPPGNAPLVIDGMGVLGVPDAAANYVLTSSTISKSCFMPASGGNWSGCNTDLVLDVGQSATLQVAFTPKAVTPLDVNLTIVSNSASPYYDVAIYGMALSAPGG